MKKLANQAVRRRRRDLRDAQHKEATAEAAYKSRVRSPFTDLTDPIKRVFERQNLRDKRQKAEREFLAAVNKKKGRKTNG